MALTIQLLGNGQLPNAIGDLYTVAASTQAIVKSIKLVNTNSSTESVNIYILPSGGTARRIIPVDTQLPASYMCDVLDEPITLEAGDKIQGDTTTATKVDYTIFGTENA